MAERMNPFSSGLALLLSGDNPRGKNPQKPHLISYHDEISHQSVERTIEHILDLPHKSLLTPPHKINTNFIRSILQNHSKTPNSPQIRVSIDKSSICGSFKTLKEPLLIESIDAFTSARANKPLKEGKWMYEVLLETSGIQQLGFSTTVFPFTENKGVGDYEDSYSFDGKRVTKWNKEPKNYGQPWSTGDVIGCCIDLVNREISFYRNGSSLGVAFNAIKNNVYYPAVSLSDGERCYLNFGSHPFVYPIEGFDPVQDPPRKACYMTYLFQCLTRLLEAESLEKSDSAYFHKLRRVKRFAPLKELFEPISHAIFTELFDISEGYNGNLEYIAWGPLTSFLMDVFRVQEPHDSLTLNRVLGLFLQYKQSASLFQELFLALSFKCKSAPLILKNCPYSGPYSFLALACEILKRKEMMLIWWNCADNFRVSFEGFLSVKVPSKKDLESLVPTVWWPGSCEDVGTEKSMSLTINALSEAISKIEEMHRQLCSLVIRFTPPGPGSPRHQTPGSVFRSFVQNLILRSRSIDHHRSPAGGSPNSSILLSLYTVILHLLSEGLGLGLGLDEKLGFLHRPGLKRFPLSLLFRNDSYFGTVPRIGGSINQLLKSHEVDCTGTGTESVQWDEESRMDSDEFRVTHSSSQKPCCCEEFRVGYAQTSKDSLRYGTGTGTGTSSKKPNNSTVQLDRSQKDVAECSSSSLSEEIRSEKRESNTGELEGGFAYQSLRVGTGTGAGQMGSDGSSEALGEEELLDLMMLLYHMGVAPSFRQAFYYMSLQSQSISLLEETDKQIREKSCAEQVKRLKEARNVHHEELVDCVRNCSWYRISLFSRWKLRGMYATCMWVVDLLLVLSESNNIFLFVPEFYIESLVDTFHALRRSDPPFVSSAVFLKQGLSSFVTFCVRHFDDGRILSADLKDLLLQSISVLMQYREFLTVFENNKAAVERMPRGLLSAFDNRSWIPVTNILYRLCKGCGFASRNSDSASSVLFQVLLRETCVHDQELFLSFLNRLFNTLSWTMTEFSMSIREMQDKHHVADAQQRKCSVIFEISCSLARILEFCVREIPQAFLTGSDMNLRRLTELVVFILNHIISAGETAFFDMSVRRPGEKTNRIMILAPILGIILNVLGPNESDSSNTIGHTNGHTSGHTSVNVNDVVSVFCSMDCPTTLHFGFQYLLDFNWSNILRGGDASIGKLAQLQELSGFFLTLSESVGSETGQVAACEDSEDNVCCICYNGGSDALFEPCRHRSCFGCITRHLLNSHRCFFCNATVTAVTRS
ncbi:hypothetical protein LUZ60_006721 [Juncus effusus]|nr:hypothetical protein LUZ60_006721 [Juncus effusus]